MSSLPAPVIPRVAQLVRMLASSHDGEALGACRAVGRVLQANGATFYDLAERIEREPEVRIVYRDLPKAERHAPSDGSWPFLKVGLEAASRGDRLTQWEADFCASILSQAATSRSWKPSPKQQDLIRALLTKLGLMETRV